MVLGIVGLVVLMFAGIFFYANVINDSPDKLDASDLSNALVQTTPPADTVDVRESVPGTDDTFGRTRPPMRPRRPPRRSTTGASTATGCRRMHRSSDTGSKRCSPA